MSTLVYSQDSLWKEVKLDENLQISFPGEVTKLDTSAVNGRTKAHFKIYTCQQESFTIMAMVTSIDGTDNNSASKRQKALKEFAIGAMESYSKKGFKCAVTDTIIRRMNCKKIVCNGQAIPLIQSFIFLAKNRAYSLQCFLNDNRDSSLLKKFLNSVQFNKDIVEAQELDSIETSTAYKVGYYSVPVVVIMVIVFFVIRKNNKNSVVSYKR